MTCLVPVLRLDIIIQNVSIQNPTPVPQMYPQNVPQPQLEPYLNPQTQRWEYPGIRNIPNPMPPPQHVPYNAAYQQPQAHMGSVPVHAPMPPPQHVPYQHSAYYQPQAQMGSVSNAVPNVSAQHQTLHSVQSNPALNNVHRGHIAHREREAAHRQSLLDQEYILRRQNDREIGNWAVPDELNRNKENEGRRRVLVPERPPSDLHQQAANQHVQNLQRMTELAPQVISRSASVPQEFLPQAGQDPGRNAAIHEKRRKKEKRMLLLLLQKPKSFKIMIRQWQIGTCSMYKSKQDKDMIREELDRRKKEAEALKDANRREHLEREAQRMRDNIRGLKRKNRGYKKKLDVHRWIAIHRAC
jgi:hypothetical protein